jgi:hypothetical protein
MPFKSKAQQRFMFATMPDRAKTWAHETKNIKKLPQHVRHIKRAAPFIAAFAGELLTKTAISSGLVTSAVRQALEHDPNRVGRFLAHLRELSGPRASAARDITVREARGFMGWGARPGNPNRAVSGTLVDGVKVGAVTR